MENQYGCTQRHSPSNEWSTQNRAMEIIDELEPAKRGVYGGAIGYLEWEHGYSVAIRTAVVKDGQAHIQAGAGCGRFSS